VSAELEQPHSGVAMRTLREAQELLFAELREPVVMREPRTWPRLDGASDDVRKVRGASGRLYYRIGIDAWSPLSGASEDSERPTARRFSHWQEADGPLTEVFEDEQGGAG